MNPNDTDPVRVAVYRAAAEHLAYTECVDDQIAAANAEARLTGRPRPTVVDFDAPRFVDEAWQRISTIAEDCMSKGVVHDPAEWAADFGGDLGVSAGAAVAAAAWLLG